MSKSKIVYVDMDDTICEYSAAAREAILKKPLNMFPQSQYGFFLSLKPKEGAIDGMKFLFDNFDTYFLSRPSVLNPLSYTEKRVWIEMHFGLHYCERLILSPQKHLSKGDYLIDDRRCEVVEDGVVVAKFEGTQLLFGSEEFPDWTSVRSYFSSKYNL